VCESIARQLEWFCQLVVLGDVNSSYIKTSNMMIQESLPPRIEQENNA